MNGIKSNKNKQIKKQKDFYNGKYDAIFKNALVFDEEAFLLFLKKTLGDLINNIDSYKLLQSELPKSNFHIRNKSLDVLLLSGGSKVILELNSSHYNSLPIRNYAYLSSSFASSVFRGESYDDVILHVMLNITWGMGDKKDLGKLYKERGTKLMEKYMKNVERLNEDPHFIQIISPEKDAEMVMNTIKNEAKAEAREEVREKIREERAKGLTEGIIKTARNFLKKKIDIDIISECTGLSKEEILKLK